MIEGSVRPIAAAPGRIDRLAARAPWPVALGRLAAGAAFAAAAGAIAIVQLPVLGHYFFGDDFVPLADIASRTTLGYVQDLFLLRDETPNWRFLTGLFYLGAYRAFGLNALPFFLTSLLVHIGTAGLIFWLVRRATGAVWPAFLAASFFGLTAAHVPTVGQVTAFNNVLAGFLLTLAVVTLYEGLLRQRLLWWLAASVVSFAGAIAANESTAVLAPVLGLTVLWRVASVDGWWRQGRQWARLALLSAPYALVGGAALAALGACRCTEAPNLYVGGGHLISNLWLYLGRLLYPVGMEFPGRIGTAHLVSGLIVAALALVALARGPGLARVSVVFLVLALVPYLPVELWAAPRYTYVAAIPFSILAALFFAEAARHGRRLTPALPHLLALVAFGVLGLYGWQTWSQNAAIESKSREWRTLVTGLQAAYPALPEGSTVYVRGSPLTDPLLQCAVFPAVGEVLWGDVKLFTFLEGELDTYRVRPGYQVYVADAKEGRITPVSVPVAAPSELASDGLVFLPHVSPSANGNLCLRHIRNQP